MASGKIGFFYKNATRGVTIALVLVMPVAIAIAAVPVMAIMTIAVAIAIVTDPLRYRGKDRDIQL